MWSGNKDAFPRRHNCRSKEPAITHHNWIMIVVPFLFGEVVEWVQFTENSKHADDNIWYSQAINRSSINSVVFSALHLLIKQPCTYDADDKDRTMISLWVQSSQFSMVEFWSEFSTRSLDAFITNLNQIFYHIHGNSGELDRSQKRDNLRRCHALS